MQFLLLKYSDAAMWALFERVQLVYKIFSSYLTQNTIHVHYKEKSEKKYSLGKQSLFAVIFIGTYK